VLKYGTKKCPGGLERFTDGIPVRIERLALDEAQVRLWNLPTRPAKRGDKRTPKFIAQYGDISVELDAIPPNDLRTLVDEAIAQHMALGTRERLKVIEAQERQWVRMALNEYTDEGGLDE
jgi:hypothetical protein